MSFEPVGSGGLQGVGLLPVDGVGGSWCDGWVLLLLWYWYSELWWCAVWSLGNEMVSWFCSQVQWCMWVLFGVMVVGEALHELDWCLDQLSACL